MRQLNRRGTRLLKFGCERFLVCYFLDFTCQKEAYRPDRFQTRPGKLAELMRKNRQLYVHATPSPRIAVKNIKVLTFFAARYKELANYPLTGF
jgi:hypothetical protein